MIGWTGRDRRSGPPPRWLAWVEIGAILALLAGFGVVRFTRLTPAEKQELQLEVGLRQLYTMEVDHFLRHGQYFPVDDPVYRQYLPWMEHYPFEARYLPTEGFSVVVRADLDGDGQPGIWRIDETSPQVRRVAPD